MAYQSATVFHNPGCGTSRNVLALLHERGIEPKVIEYLKTPPTRTELSALIARSGLPALDFLRTREKLYGELDLANPKWSEEQLVRLPRGQSIAVLIVRLWKLPRECGLAGPRRQCWNYWIDAYIRPI